MDVIMMAIVGLTVYMFLIATWQVCYEAEMKEFRRSSFGAALDVVLVDEAAYAPSVRAHAEEMLGYKDRFRSQLVEQFRNRLRAEADRKLRNYCACRTCNHARQRSMMLRN